MRRLHHVVVVLSLAASPVFAQQPDPRELMRQSIQNYEKSWRAGGDWAYTQTDVSCVDGTKVVEVSDIVPLDGTPYERLISKNGHPLSPEEQRKEDDKFDRERRRRERETPEQRRARIDKYDKQRDFAPEILQAYNFTIEGEDRVNGRPAWIVKLTQKPGFQGATPRTEMLKHIDGKLWIDKQDVQWSRAEADVTDTISIGFIVARIGPGAHIALDFQRISDSFWAPRNISIKGVARVFLVYNKDIDEELAYTDYHQPGSPSPAAVARR